MRLLLPWAASPGLWPIDVRAGLYGDVGPHLLPFTGNVHYDRMRETLPFSNNGYM